MRSVLIADGTIAFLSRHAQSLLDSLRQQWHPLLRQARLVIARHGDQVFLYTFAGGRINNVLGKVLELETGAQCSIDNLRLRAPLPAQGPFEVQFRRALALTSTDGYFTEARLDAMLARLSRGRLSKFQPYLPPRFERELLAARLLDVEGARFLAGERCVSVYTGQAQLSRQVAFDEGRYEWMTIT